MPNSFYQITVSNFSGRTPCQSYSVYTGVTHDIDDADYVEDVTTPVSGYTLSLSIDSVYTHIFLFIEHCDGHINSVPTSTPKLQGGYQVTLVDLRCNDCVDLGPVCDITYNITTEPVCDITYNITTEPVCDITYNITTEPICDITYNITTDILIT